LCFDTGVIIAATDQKCLAKFPSFQEQIVCNWCTYLVFSWSGTSAD